MQGYDLQGSLSACLQRYENRSLLFFIIYRHLPVQIFLGKFPDLLDLRQTPRFKMSDLHRYLHPGSLMIFQPQINRLSGKYRNRIPPVCHLLHFVPKITRKSHLIIAVPDDPSRKPLCYGQLPGAELFSVWFGEEIPRLFFQKILDFFHCKILSSARLEKILRTFRQHGSLDNKQGIALGQAVQHLHLFLHRTSLQKYQIIHPRLVRGVYIFIIKCSAGRYPILCSPVFCSQLKDSDLIQSVL